ncbi:hypothetical protein FQN54_008858 [Arachnomyces sp. PD_36]|nr:hypothetical protein FQN54_008858 [Arachnomyces sp. PD_36]
MTPRPIFHQSPVCPIPPEFDVEAHIQMLEEMIRNPDTKEDQKPNLQLALDLYNKGELPKYGVMFFQDGKVTTLQELHPRSSWWAEGTARQ